MIELLCDSRGGWRMTKRLIDLDDDLVVAAQRELRTTDISDTVCVALRYVAAGAARTRQVAWLKEGSLGDLADPEQRGTVWR